MKKQKIRIGVWETNSSSAHSLSLGSTAGKEFLLDTIYPDQDGVITLTGGEFGWEWFKTNDSLEKANYAAVDSVSKDLLEQVIKDVTGCERVDFKVSTDWNDSNYSYIDHESVGTTPNTYEELKDFIFNKNSWLFGGNDNTTADPMFYQVPEYKDGKLIQPKFRFELKVEGYSKTTKFTDYPSEREIKDGLESLIGDVKLDDSGCFDNDNSIYAQIYRNKSNYYEFNPWRKPVDLENGICYFCKDIFQDARDLWENQYGKETDWQGPDGYAKCREIEETLKNDPKYFKAVKFSINEI